MQRRDTLHASELGYTEVDGSEANFLAVRVHILTAQIENWPEKCGFLLPNTESKTSRLPRSVTGTIHNSIRLKKDTRVSRM